jgi:tRNA(Leu) C34 or U34 (ribose-2'-O)-methylase TrmL
MRRALTTPELRRTKPSREEFLTQPRRPITVVLDGVIQNYNIGAIFRLCDAFLVQQLVICGTKVDLHKRRLVQAAQGTQHWVPWSERQHASDAVAEAKALGAWIVVAEQTTASLRPAELVPMFPVCLVLGGERNGVSPEAIEVADAAVAIPMLGIANSLNVRPPRPYCFIGFQRVSSAIRNTSHRATMNKIAPPTTNIGSLRCHGQSSVTPTAQRKPIKVVRRIAKG